MSKMDVKNLKGLTLDSRGVKKCYLFAALAGSKTDGRKYIGDAVRNGATYVLAQTGTAWPDGVSREGVEFVTADNPRRELALLAAEFYKVQPGTIVAVTGTNGKTSTAHFVKQLWKKQGLKAASIGTLGIRAPGFESAGAMTTPDPVTLHAQLADLAAAGVTHLAMEASSHGLDQYRLDGVKVSAAGFTSFSRDHLDYHKDMDDYLAAKKRLFGEILIEGGTAVLNADIDEYGALADAARAKGHRILSYGFKGEDLRLIETHAEPEGHHVRAEILGRETELHLKLVGEFQVMNALCALGLVLAGDEDRAQDYIAALENMQGAPGRLDLVGGHPKGAAIYVDYAHTPDALEHVLKALRPHTEGRLVCLFGCGGDRDAGKRPIMGRVATDLSDRVIVTDDNPRSEDPAKIRQAILEAAPGAEEISGRRDAIRRAVEDLQEGDVLVIAGKGHEQGQVFHDRQEEFDDRVEAAKAIGDMKQ